MKHLVENIQNFLHAYNHSYSAAGHKTDGLY
jgi:hypothetical protein